MAARAPSPMCPVLAGNLLTSCPESCGRQEGVREAAPAALVAPPRVRSHARHLLRHMWAELALPPGDLPLSACTVCVTVRPIQSPRETADRTHTHISDLYKESAHGIICRAEQEARETHGHL